MLQRRPIGLNTNGWNTHPFFYSTCSSSNDAILCWSTRQSKQNQFIFVIGKMWKRSRGMSDFVSSGIFSCVVNLVLAACSIRIWLVQNELHWFCLKQNIFFLQRLISHQEEMQSHGICPKKTGTSVTNSDSQCGLSNPQGMSPSPSMGWFSYIRKTLCVYLCVLVCVWKQCYALHP